MTLPISEWLSEVVDRNGAPPSPSPSELRACLGSLDAAVCDPASPETRQDPRQAPEACERGLWMGGQRVEVEEESGPPTSRPSALVLDLDLICYLEDCRS